MRWLIGATPDGTGSLRSAPAWRWTHMHINFSSSDGAGAAAGPSRPAAAQPGTIWEWYADKRLRQPVEWLDRLRMFGVFRYGDVRSILTSKEFTVEYPFRASRLVFGETLLDMDGPRHRELRQFLIKVLTDSATDEYFRHCVDEQVSLCLDAVGDNGAVDFVDQVAREIPARVTCAFLGLPHRDYRDVSRAILELASYLEGGNADMVASAPVRRQLDQYLEAASSASRDVPSRSMIGRLRAHTEKLNVSAEEALRILVLLLAAGTETSICSLGNTMVCLLNHPPYLHELERDPSSAGLMVQEALRYLPPQHHTVRFALADHVMHGVRISKGQPLRLYLASANRDAAIFSCADEFLPRRPESETASFGLGIHSCLGRKIGIYQVQRAFQLIFERFEAVQYAGTEPPVMSVGMFSGPVSVPIRLRRKGSHG